MTIPTNIPMDIPANIPMKCNVTLSIRITMVLTTRIITWFNHLILLPPHYMFLLLILLSSSRSIILLFQCRFECFHFLLFLQFRHSLPLRIYRFPQCCFLTFCTFPLCTFPFFLFFFLCSPFSFNLNPLSFLHLFPPFPLHFHLKRPLFSHSPFFPLFHCNIPIIFLFISISIFFFIIILQPPMNVLFLLFLDRFCSVHCSLSLHCIHSLHRIAYTIYSFNGIHSLNFHVINHSLCSHCSFNLFIFPLQSFLLFFPPSLCFLLLATPFFFPM